MSQYHYLDESGDPGLDGDAGSTPCFVLAMVQTPWRRPLPELERLRRVFHLRSDFEFRYYRTTPVQKEAFFRAVHTVPFRTRAVALRKVGRLQQFVGMSGQEVTIELIAGLALRASELDIARDVLIVDGGTPAFRRALRIRLSSECRRLCRIPPFSKVIGADSRREDGLQLADMVAGAVRQHVMGAQSGYYRMLESKVMDLWELPVRRQ